MCGLINSSSVGDIRPFGGGCNTLFIGVDATRGSGSFFPDGKFVNQFLFLLLFIIIVIIVIIATVSRIVLGPVAGYPTERSQTLSGINERETDSWLSVEGPRRALHAATP